MARKNVYELQFAIEAQDILKSKKLGRDVTLYFEKKEIVIGEPYQKEWIIVEDRYIIPLDYVEKTSKFPYLKKDSKFDETINRIKAQSVQMSEREKEGFDKIGAEVKDVIEGRTKEKINAKAKMYKNGALMGLGSGVLLALYLRKNIWFFGLVGVAVGGYVASKIQNAKEGNNEVEPIA
jgi:hypothetical protein